MFHSFQMCFPFLYFTIFSLKGEMPNSFLMWSVYVCVLVCVRARVCVQMWFGRWSSLTQEIKITSVYLWRKEKRYFVVRGKVPDVLHTHQEQLCTNLIYIPPDLSKNTPRHPTTASVSHCVINWCGFSVWGYASLCARSAQQWKVLSRLSAKFRT
jgi:hypothetical protein